MPRDSGGVYSLPPGSTATTGQTILASELNTPLQDIASALTASLPVDGSKAMSGPLKAADGSAISPSITFAADTKTGVYRIGANNIGIAANSAKVLDIGTGGLGITGTLSTSDVLTQNSTSHEVLPKGTTAQRPTSQVAARFRFNSDLGFPEFDDGVNWNSIRPFSGSFVQYGDIINGTIVESHASNAVTYSLKTLAGNNPSATDPVFVAFRNSTSGTGNYVFRTITSATSLTISSGSTLGASNATAFRVWLVLFDDAGTIRLGAINCLNGLNIYPLRKTPLASSTAEGGAGGADSAHVFFTGTAVTSKPYVVLGYCSYESGLATAGTWNAGPDVIQLYGPGVPLPGAVIQTSFNSTSTITSASSTTPVTTNLTGTITPTSAANLIRIVASGSLTGHSATNGRAEGFLSLFRNNGATQIGNIAPIGITGASGSIVNTAVPAYLTALDAPNSSSSTQYGVFITKISAGAVAVDFPGTSGSLPTNLAVMTLDEIMA